MTSKSALVILLHGVGGSGSNMLPIATTWRSAMPHIRFASPDAPFAHSYGGHQWFGIDGLELKPDRIESVRDAFDKLVEQVVNAAGFGERLDRVAIMGVSQGAIVGLDAVASGRWQVRALVSIAGLLPPMHISAKARTTAMCLIHGAADQTIPASETKNAARRLKGAGIDVESHIIPGIGHTVSQEELVIAQDFMSQRLPA